MKEGGFTYLLLLFFVAILGVGLAVAGEAWHVSVQREKEEQLLFAGDAYRQAIELYYETSPGGVKQYPLKLDDLLRDPRFPNVRRYLRELYPDPITGKFDWELVMAPQGGIMGIYSPSKHAPMKRSGFDDLDAAFGDLAKQKKDKLIYRDWKFVYDPALALGRLSHGLF